MSVLRSYATEPLKKLARGETSGSNSLTYLALKGRKIKVYALCRTFSAKALFLINQTFHVWLVSAAAPPSKNVESSDIFRPLHSPIPENDPTASQNYLTNTPIYETMYHASVPAYLRDI